MTGNAMQTSGLESGAQEEGVEDRKIRHYTVNFVRHKFHRHI